MYRCTGELGSSWDQRSYIGDLRSKTYDRQLEWPPSSAVPSRYGFSSASVATSAQAFLRNLHEALDNPSNQTLFSHKEVEYMHNKDLRLTPLLALLENVNVKC